MKFRTLSLEELGHLEEDLKHFLIVNGIDSETWLYLNKNESNKALQLIQLFSDIVLQKVYEKMSFLEFRSIDSCMVFHCKNDVMELITIQKKNKSLADLSTPQSIHSALINNTDELTFFHTSKKYKINREQEIHQLIEKGCVVSTYDFWNSLLNSIET